MHIWGDDNVDWEGINDAAWFIAKNLRRWGRVGVRDHKEKWGTCRVYCSLGWDTLHSITHPGYCFCQYPTWLWYIDCRYTRWFVHPLSRLVLPYHKWLYRHLYRRAVEKWPHLRAEITRAADFPELLEGI